VRRLALARLAADLGISVQALERQAWRMARAKRELGAAVVKLKLERCGMRLTLEEELEIARVHQIMTLAAADVNRAIKALEPLRDQSLILGTGLEHLVSGVARIIGARPHALCSHCRRGPDMAECKTCHGRGWVARWQRA